MKRISVCTLSALLILGTIGPAYAGSFAGAVISYDSGSTPALQWPSNLPYDNPAAALGMPDGVTGEEGIFGPSLLSPFSGADERAEVVSVGEGGHLTLQLANYVLIGPGLDLGVIENAGLLDSAWPNGVAGTPAAVLEPAAAVVEVSENGTDWVDLGQLSFDIPANYYTNATAYNVDPPEPPQVADFCKPFDPPGGLSAFDGLNFAQILALLDGSGGGTWLDLSPSGLAQVGYIRFSVADDSDAGTELNFDVDAVCIANGKEGAPVGAAPVSEPAALGLVAAAFGARVLRTRRT